MDFVGVNTIYIEIKAGLNLIEICFILMIFVLNHRVGI